MIPNGGLEDLWNGAREGILGALIALFFGVLRYGQDFLSPEPPKFLWRVLFLKGITAGAAGWLATWLLLEWNWIPEKIYLSGILISLSGWGGAEFINVIKEGLYDFLRRKFSDAGGQKSGKKDDGAEG